MNGGDKMYADFLEAIEYLERRGYYVFKNEREILDYILKNEDLLQELLSEIEGR
jgi:hypothetical protein